MSVNLLTDGPTIEVDESDYEPDAIVTVRDRHTFGRHLAVPDPTVIVEVLSPTTRRIDVSRKLVDYYRLPSVHHHLILFSDRVQAVHHRRADEQIETRVSTPGDVILDPPGLTVPLARFYPP